MEETKQIAALGQSLTIAGRPGDPYFDHFNLGDHTNDFLLYVAKSFIRPDAVVFDVGANIGVTSAIFSLAAPQGRTFAFEPSPSIYPYLLKTIEANRMGRCLPRQLALGARPGQLQFFDNPTSASASHLVIENTTLGGATTSVKVSTIDDVVANDGVKRLDLVKIDVEGLELDVLAGAKKTLSALEPDVFLEFNSFTLIAFGNQNPRFVLEQLLSIFPYVYRFEAGQAHEIRDARSILAFIHDNLVKRGCIDDLFCRFTKI